MNNLLSIDFGERYMGFAIRTVKTQIPIPIEVVDIKKDNIANKISTFVDSYDINEFIIGYPLGMNLSENRMTNNVDNFIEEELKKYNLPISKIDERFTSELIKNSKKDRVDDLSALEILETYIKKMIKFLFKNRTALQIFLVISFLLVGYNVTSSIADNVEVNTIDGSQNIDDLKIINVNIPQGSSASEISSILDSTGVITSKLAFELYLRNENLTDKLRSGTYEIPNNLNFEELTSVLLKGPPLKTYTITIPEGLWLSETLETISAQTGYDVIQLENSLISGNVESSFLPDNDFSNLQNWEGLLFPNTYQIDIDANGEDILQILADELESRYNNLLSSNSIPSWISSPNEFFTVASLIEAEAKLDEDRPLVSSVIRNRLDQNMLLQIDATVLYSLQKKKTQVLLIDLQVDSPYNTYKYTSLPPTPISGFGEKSMEAIFNTPENPFIYYLLTDINGKMTFTDNYEEFINLKNKAKDEGVIP